ncbi:MAG: hypothetical protein KGL39_12895 [Patescibacteria group bacterium]|nr:hypothetical protein [Patescibacteria group bacterium]
MPHLTHPRGRGVRSVTIETIPHSEHRYPTCGDWIYDPAKEHLTVRVSETGDWRESFCVAVHELVEAGICVQCGIDPDAVDEFDMHFEQTRDLQDDPDGEPGDDPKAPYYHQHQLATNIEHSVATHLGLHWPTHNANLGSLE